VPPCFYCDKPVTVTVKFTGGRTRHFCDYDYLVVRRMLSSLDDSSYTVRFLERSRHYGEGLHV
jgi:hypothetical protein